jgi:6-phosphogluconolactonase
VLEEQILTAEIRILADGTAIARRTADLWIAAAKSAVEQKGVFRVALSGGSTPKTLYTLLATDANLRAQIPWGKTQFFFGDERHVPPDHMDSNFRMADDAMLSQVPAKPDQVHRIKAEYGDAEKAALEYEQDLRTSFQLAAGQLPRFDLFLVGMGDEGHALSLFPGTKALHDNGRLVMRNWVGKFYTDRVTMTAPVANNAALIVFMVTKADKAPALKAVLEGPHEPEQLPSQLFAPTNGKLLWLVDKDAAGMLSGGTRE